MLGILPDKLGRMAAFALMIGSCVPNREACYAAAEARAATKAFEHCKGEDWETCEVNEEVLDQLEKDYKACP